MNGGIQCELGVPALTGLTASAARSGQITQHWNTDLHEMRDDCDEREERIYDENVHGFSMQAIRNMCRSTNVAVLCMHHCIVPQLLY